MHRWRINATRVAVAELAMKTVCPVRRQRQPDATAAVEA